MQMFGSIESLENVLQSPNELLHVKVSRPSNPVVIKLVVALIELLMSLLLIYHNWEFYGVRIAANYFILDRDRFLLRVILLVSFVLLRLRRDLLFWF